MSKQNAAEKAVAAATETPETWQGDKKHDEQVIFANGVYTVASNGDAEDYTTAENAAAALLHQWQQQDRNK